MVYAPNISIIFEQPTQTLEATGCISLRAKRSIHSLVDTAVIEFPITAHLVKEGKLMPGEQTGHVFKEDDKVEIFAGHNGELISEFKGFVKPGVGIGDPCIIECEGYSRQLRKAAPRKSWKSAKLREILTVLIEGTDIKIHPDTPKDVKIAPFYMGLKGENGLQVLQALKDTGAFIAYFIDGDQLYVGPEEFALRDKEVVHSLGYNTLDDDKLRYRDKDEVKVHCNITYRDEKGKTHHTTAGTKGGLELKYNFGRLSNADAAKALALKKATLHSYEGFEGRIKTTWVPYCQPGWASTVYDEEYKQREQKCIVETVECIMGPQGDERIVELGKTISRQV